VSAVAVRTGLDETSTLWSAEQEGEGSTVLEGMIESENMRSWRNAMLLGSFGSGNTGVLLCSLPVVAPLDC
jgi:hypothetical protein